MNKKQRQRMIKWCEALESGQYEQGRSRLKTCVYNKTTFCCLGVAADLYNPNKWHENSNYMWDEENFTYGCLSHVGLEYYGLTTRQQETLIQLNDGGSSFLEISQYIRKNILGEENATESINCQSE